MPQNKFGIKKLLRMLHTVSFTTRVRRHEDAMKSNCRCHKNQRSLFQTFAITMYCNKRITFKIPSEKKHPSQKIDGRNNK